MASAVALAACGGTGTGTGPSAGVDPLLKLAQCMRAHGVPNFPDPGAGGGGVHIGPGTGIDPGSPSFQAAQKACSKYGGPSTAPVRMSESQRQAALRFAQCVRSHGDSSFPDPSLSPPKGAAAVIVLRGMVFAFHSAFDPRSPAFQQASAACGLRLPTGGRAKFLGRP